MFKQGHSIKAVETERRGWLSITGAPTVGAFDRMPDGRAACVTVNTRRRVMMNDYELPRMPSIVRDEIGAWLVVIFLLLGLLVVPALR